MGFREAYDPEKMLTQQTCVYGGIASKEAGGPTPKVAESTEEVVLLFGDKTNQ